MAVPLDEPAACWMIQEPEGPAGPKTPDRWVPSWTTDSARLEEAHHNGDAEVVVFGRKYVVDVKERTVRPLYWEEEPAVRPVARATYFRHETGPLNAATGWLPYSERDSELLEDAYIKAKISLKNPKTPKAEVRLTDGENKVVMTRAPAGECGDEFYDEFKIKLHHRPVKAPPLNPSVLLAEAYHKRACKVRRGLPKKKIGWGATANDDRPVEAKTPRHVVFVLHGMGESLRSKGTASMPSFRASMSPMRAMSAECVKRMGGDDTAATPVAPQAGKQGVKNTEQGLSNPPEGVKASGRREGGIQEAAVKGGGDNADGGEGTPAAGYVEFLPVEWFAEVHGEHAVGEGMMQAITLPSILAFRDFANQAMMDVMYYLMPDMQAAILSVVGRKMNEMWMTFMQVNPDFSGKVSVLGHSLGSVIAHDILMAQPGKGSTEPGLEGCPILSFDPEVFLACGSPIGMFLTLRQSTLDKEKLFKFTTTNHFFNVFHSVDPVAYRLEPLVDKRLRDLPPEQVPHKGRNPIHVSVKKLNKDFDAAIHRMAQQTGAGWHAFQSKILKSGELAIGESDTVVEEAPIPDNEVDEAKKKLERRIDWAIQETTLEGIHPWASAVFAHGSYFEDADMMMFLIDMLERATRHA